MDNFSEIEPTLETLSQLAQDSLQQNLAKAVRLWVILNSIEGNFSDLGVKFSLYQWMDRFFGDFSLIHKQAKVNQLKSHDPQCPCQKSLGTWLYDHLGEEKYKNWQKDFLNSYKLIDSTKLESLLSQEQLFAISRRSLQNDLTRLCKLGWLKALPAQTLAKERILYQKNSLWELRNHNRSTTDNRELDVSNLVNNDLSDFFNDFGQKINGHQRFFLDLEYIIHARLSDHIDQLRQSLKNIWSQESVFPIRLKYFSARKYQEKEDAQTYLTYPVCLYYSQRVPYLFAFGQRPQDDHIDWYDFRLDRIKSLREISWTAIDFQRPLEQLKQAGKPYNDLEQRLFNAPTLSEQIKIYQHYCYDLTPQSIHDFKAEAWGFDFFRPKRTMIIRFDRYFYARYIEGTERAELFRPLAFDTLKLVFKNEYSSYQEQTILERIQANSHDVYCRVVYRDGDYNIIMRLRAWGSNVEVLSPKDLRQQMRQESQQLFSLYKDV